MGMHPSIEALPSENLLKLCAATWGLKDIQFVRKMENIVFSCGSEEGKVYLRLTTPLRRSKREIQAEVDWIEHLARSDLKVPHIIPAKNGYKVVSFEEGSQHYEGVVFSAMPGDHPSEEHVQDPAFLRTLGSLIAKMHKATVLYDGHDRGLRREEWFEERGLRHALEAAAHSEEEGLKNRLQDTLAWMKQLPRTKETYGLVHADLGALNVFICDDNSIGFIDFDDSCYHWYVFDLAIVIYSMTSRFKHERPLPIENIWLEHLLKGYLEVRPLTNEEIALIPKLIQFACLRLFFWIEHHQTLHTFHEEAIEKVAQMKQWAKKRIISY